MSGQRSGAAYRPVFVSAGDQADIRLERHYDSRWQAFGPCRVSSPGVAIDCCLSRTNPCRVPRAPACISHFHDRAQELCDRTPRVSKGPSMPEICYSLNMQSPRGLWALCSLFIVSALVSGQSTPHSGIDLKAIDTSVDPCQNFYRYACGNWMKNNPVPPQYSRCGRFNELQDHNQEILRQILEDSVQHQDRSPIDQKIGAFYSTCMNEEAVDKAGDTPVVPGIERIRALKQKADLAAEVARLHNQDVSVFFRFASTPDPDDARMTIADIDQGGLGLPDRSYYLQPKDEQTRRRYAEHVTTILSLAGYSSADASTAANKILALETALAKASLDRTARRDPHLTHHKMTVEQLQALSPDFDVKQYCTDRGAPSFTSLNVSVPDFFKSLNQELSSTSLDDLKNYMIWHYVSAYAPQLSKPFVEANFDFYDRYLTGAKELQPRWKRCVQLTDRNLGEALGQKYVERAFAGQSKEKTQQLVNIIEKEMEVDIDSLTWMTSATKQQAIAKLKGVTNKIGYPEKWRDYSSVNVSADNLVADVRNAREFETRRNLNKIGKPVDRKEFGMTPPTVNAYYNPLQNNINFPAGILQPPFYSNNIDDAVNYGAIGAVVGHELTHGFDDEGRQFDAQGNLRDWWKPEDARRFEERTDCLVKEYSSFSVEDSVHVNGKLTLGENTADNGGIRLALMAFLAALANKPKSDIDGFTPEQRFFLGYGQIWCENVSPELARMLANVDPHSPPRYRVNGVLSNMPEFQKAFGCAAGQPMVRRPACRVW